MKYLFTLSLLLVFINLSAQQTSWSWVKKAGGTGADGGSAVCTDNAGNIYYTGGFTPDAYFGNDTLHGSVNNGFIAKYSQNGQFKKVIETAGGSDINADKLGNLYYSGTFSDSITIFDSTFYATGSIDIFIASIDTAGNFRWALQGRSSTQNLIYGNAVDGSDNLYITGIFKNNFTLGGISISGSSATNYDMFIAKIGSDGNVEWILPAGGTGAANIFPAGICADKNGNAYVSGTFSGNSTIGIPFWGTHSLTGDYNDFIAKADANGVWQWATNIGYNPHWSMEDLAVDSSGNCYTLGSFGYSNLPITIDGTITFNAYGAGSDFYVAKWNPSGNVVWARHGGAPGSFDHAQSIAVSAGGDVYITGISGTGGIFGSYTVSGFGSNDIVAVKYDTNGNEQWALCAGSSSMDEPKDIAIDELGNAYITGFYMSAATFGSVTVTGGNNQGNAFLAKIENPAITSLADNASNTNNLFVFPNPANDYLNIQLSQELKNDEVNIYSAEGKLIQSQVLSSFGKMMRLNVGAFADGFYYLKAGENATAVKFIVSKKN